MRQLFVGVPHYDDTGKDEGGVFVFELVNDAWTQSDTLTVNGTSNLGLSVAVSGDTVSGVLRRVPACCV